MGSRRNRKPSQTSPKRYAAACRWDDQRYDEHGRAEHDELIVSVLRLIRSGRDPAANQPKDSISAAVRKMAGVMVAKAQP